MQEEVDSIIGKRNTIFDAGIEYGGVVVMNTARKITVEVPEELLESAASHRRRYHANGAHGIAAFRGFADLRAITVVAGES